MLKVLADKSVKPVHIFVIRYTFSFEVKAVVVNPKLHNPTKQLKTCGIFLQNVLILAWNQTKTSHTCSLFSSTLRTEYGSWRLNTVSAILRPCWIFISISMSLLYFLGDVVVSYYILFHILSLTNLHQW